MKTLLTLLLALFLFTTANAQVTPGFSPCGINFSDGVWNTTAGMGYFHGYEIARPYDLAWGDSTHGQTSFRYTARNDWDIVLELDLQASPDSVLIVILDDLCDTVMTATTLFQFYLIDKNLSHDTDYYVHVEVHHQTNIGFNDVAFIRIVHPKPAAPQVAPSKQMFWNNQGMYQLRIIRPALNKQSVTAIRTR